MACCLTAPSHYLNQSWLLISEVLWHSYMWTYSQWVPKQIFSVMSWKIIKPITDIFSKGLTGHSVWINMKFVWYKYFFLTNTGKQYHIQAIFFWQFVWLSFYFFARYGVFTWHVGSAKSLMLSATCHCPIFCSVDKMWTWHQEILVSFEKHSKFQNSKQFQMTIGDPVLETYAQRRVKTTSLIFAKNSNKCSLHPLNVWLNQDKHWQR